MKIDTKNKKIQFESKKEMEAFLAEKLNEVNEGRVLNIIGDTPQSHVTKFSYISFDQFYDQFEQSCRDFIHGELDEWGRKMDIADFDFISAPIADAIIRKFSSNWTLDFVYDIGKDWKFERLNDKIWWNSKSANFRVSDENFQDIILQDEKIEG